MVTTVSFIRPTKAKANAGVCERKDEGERGRAEEYRKPQIRPDG